MFTQCSKCETVFRLSAEALRAAGGQVRCGRCGEVFNALSRLAEDVSGFTRGESPLSLESRADEILESSTADAAAESIDIESSEDMDGEHLPPGVEHAQLQFIGIVDDDLAAETSLEFTLPPGELDRIFIENPNNPLHQLTAEDRRAERTEALPPHPEALPPHRESLPPHPESRRLLVDDTPPTPVPAPPRPATAPPRLVAAAPTGAVAASAPPTAAPGPTPTPAALKAVPTPALTRISGLEVSEDIRQEMLASLRVVGPARNDARTDAPRGRWKMFAWLTAAILLSILLAVQLVRGNRDWVAVHLPWFVTAGPTAATLSVYQLRQWGVTGDPGANGRLTVRASIMNTAPELRPYPLLRVSLVNRFGSRIGARDFQPAEYLGHEVARMLAPGERIDATLDILDPGKEAEGFDIDVCLKSADAAVVCLGDAAAHAK